MKKVLNYICPVCKKHITSKYLSQFEWNVESHKKACAEKQERLKE